MTMKKVIQEDRDVSGVPITLILAMILAIAIVVFAIQNSTDVNLSFFTLELVVPLSLLLFCTLGLGVTMAILLSIPGWRRKRKIIKQLQKSLKLMKEDKISSIKTHA